MRSRPGRRPRPGAHTSVVGTANTTEFNRLHPKAQAQRWAADDRRRGLGPADDEIFFRIHPEAEFRVRLASPVETHVASSLFGAPPADQFVWIVVRRLDGGRQERLALYAPPPAGPIAGIPEDVAREIFLTATGEDHA